MASMLVDGSFELNDAAWTWVGDGGTREEDAAQAFHGIAYAKASHREGQFGLPNHHTEFGQQVTLSSIEPHVLSYVFRLIEDATSALSVTITVYDGWTPIGAPVTQVLSQDVYRADETTFAPWTMRSQQFTPTGTRVTIVIRTALWGPIGKAVWHFDYLSVLTAAEFPMAKGLWDGWSALNTGLATINGAPGGYWYDYASKVFATLILPDENEEGPEFYLCVPFLDYTEQFFDQQRGARCEWNQDIIVFARDTKADPTLTGAVETVSKVRDDLVRYLLTEPKLNSATVDNVSLTAGYRTAGVGGGDAWGQYTLSITVTQYVGPDDLGPDA